MNDTPSRLVLLDTLDSPEMAGERRRELMIPRDRASLLGHSAVDAAERGWYPDETGERVDWAREVKAAVAAKRSIPPEEELAPRRAPLHPETKVRVANITTMQAAADMAGRGERPLVLNFANGMHPGGGFRSGALAQEEVLCRSSALYATLEGDPMYESHRRRPRPDSTDWVIHSPGVPVFRTDDGRALPRPWLMDVLTSAAPYAPTVGQPESGDLLQKRIHRVLEIASSLGSGSLVLGAWGCGAFSNDTWRTATDFRSALEQDYAGHFRDVVFAIADWSPERRFLGQFAKAFS